MAATPEDSPSRRRKSSQRARRAHLLGLGLDNADGHKRITQGEKFTVLGGSEKTHEAITETVIKTFEGLKRKGKTLEEADPREIRDLIEQNRPKE